MLPELPSIADAQTLMRRGKLRPIDLVEHCLGRIHQFEDQIHAWVMVDEEGARKEAQRLGKMLDDGQEPVGPLHGIPIGIKDIIDVAGWPTLCGSKLREGHVADKDAFVVANLRKAGAIILGKTVTTEWASFDPPPTRNPWNLNHTPGGSSSGSAASVAMEMCMASLGTQTGGSIVRPASYCGVVGLKPQFDELTLDGIFPFAKHLDHLGPIAKTVTDAAEVWCPLAFGIGFSEMERPPKETYALSLLVPKGDFLDQADAETRSKFERATALFANAGLQIREVPIPESLADVHRQHRRIMAYEAAQVHHDLLVNSPHSLGPKIRGLLEEGSRLTVSDYQGALEAQARAKKDFWSTNVWTGAPLSVLVMPSTPTAAPGTETTGDPIFNSPWSFTGLPSITIPYALTEDGLPIGIQFISRFTYDLCRYAQDCEEIITWKRLPRLLATE